MRTPSNAELIQVWEQGANTPSMDRALLLLSACTGQPPEVLAELSIGARDAKLLEVFELLFGSKLNAFASCPACGEALEYDLSTQELASQAPVVPHPQLQLKDEGMSLKLRLPTTLDLRWVAAHVDAEAAGRLLMERCVVSVERDGQQIAAADLPDSALEPIGKALVEADPGAETLIDLSCAACSYSWQLTFDIERFLWPKISAAAKRLLRDVHALASAYGWPERDILALTPVRRQAYVEMAWQAI